MKKDYMTRLERWARWMLPRQEAEEVISDYRDMFGTPPRSEEELRRDLGKPREVVKPLAQKKQYRAWLAVFAVMAVIVAGLGISPTGIGYPIWLYGFTYANRHIFFFAAAALSAGTALVWFRRTGSKGERLPIAIPILLAVFLVCVGAVLLYCRVCSRDLTGFLELWGKMKPLMGPNSSVWKTAYLSTLAMCYGCPLIGVTGVIALVKARTKDRRWAAVYILALAAILCALWMLRSFNTLTPASSVAAMEEQFRQLLTQCSIIAAVGLAGTGVALC